MDQGIFTTVHLRHPQQKDVVMGAKNGLVKKRGGWQAVARVRVKGKIVMRRQLVAGTKEDAKRIRQLLTDEIRTGTSSSLTLEIRTYKDICAVYRDKCGPFSRTHEYNVSRLEKEFGDFSFEVFPNRFEVYIRLMRADGKNHQANRFVEVARAAYQIALDLGKIKTNPINTKRFPEAEEIPRDVVISRDDIWHIVKTAARNHRTSHIARALQYYFSVPCRKSELVKMTVGDVDEFNMAIRVYSGTTKNNKGVWKPIPPWMHKWIRRQMCRPKHEPLFYREVRGSRKDRSNQDVRRVSLGDFKNAWDTTRRAAGFPDLRIHDSRHVAATELIDNDTPEQVVMTVAGWKSNMLSTYYNRQPKKALELVRFERRKRCESTVNPQTGLRVV